MIVAVTGAGVLQEPRVWGPWRSYAKAQAALARYEAAERQYSSDQGYPAEIVALDPEHGGPNSLTQFLRDWRTEADPQDG